MKDSWVSWTEMPYCIEEDGEEGEDGKRRKKKGRRKKRKRKGRGRRRKRKMKGRQEREVNWIEIAMIESILLCLKNFYE